MGYKRGAGAFQGKDGEIGIMTFTEVATMVSEIGLPYAYYEFTNTEVAPPFIVFFYGNSNDFKADNSNYQKIERLYVELYANEKSVDLEATVEGLLASYDMVWARDEEWIPGESLYEVVYTMDVVITDDAASTEDQNG